MEQQELFGSDLKRYFERANARRILDGKPPILQKDLAEALGVSPTSISNAFAGIHGLENLCRRIKQFLDNNLSDHMYNKPLVTR